MLPTFVIGLREGLEATLIVSIIATFLRRNGASLRGLWVGVAGAVAISLGVGVALQVLNRSLPQREQEGLETVIAVVAVFFVTSMILWMRAHARFLKRDLEAAASQALGAGTTAALTTMVFLSVLREGFETSVFLLSTFQASTDATASAAGAVIGIACAVALGYAIYRGGVRLDLARFFRFTGVFLVLVAAGLVLSALRTAHEAGWVTVGQGTTVDLSWLAPTGAVRTALVSGVLGLPRDPRQIELLGWGCYLVPMLVLTLWPARWKVPTATASRVRRVAAGALVATAAVLFVAVPLPSTAVPTSTTLRGGGTATVTVDGDRGELTTSADGSGAATRWTLTDPTPTATSGADTAWTVTAPAVERPATLTLTDLLAYTGNRIPVGLDAVRSPGPFEATWTARTTGEVLTREGGLVDGSATTRLVLTLSGGGLTSPRAFTVVGSTGATGGTASANAFAVAPGAAARTSELITAESQTRADHALWKHWLPVALLVVAAGLVLRDQRERRRDRGAPSAPAASAPTAPAPGTDRTPSARPAQTAAR